MNVDHVLALAAQSINTIEELEMIVKRRESAKATHQAYKRQMIQNRLAINEIEIESEQTNSDSEQETDGEVNAIAMRERKNFKKFQTEVRQQTIEQKHKNHNRHVKNNLFQL